MQRYILFALPFLLLGCSMQPKTTSVRVLPATIDPDAVFVQERGTKLALSNDEERAASFQPASFDPAQSQGSLITKVEYQEERMLKENGETYYFIRHDNEELSTEQHTFRAGPLVVPFSLDEYAFLWYMGGKPFPKNVIKDPHAELDLASEVLELKNNGVRKALYTHVMPRWTLSEDGKSLGIAFYQFSNGRWEKRQQIVDIPTGQSYPLPFQVCSEGRFFDFGEWQNGMLITDGAYETGVQSLCVWSPQGKLLARVDVDSLKYYKISLENSVHVFTIIPAFAKTEINAPCHITVIALDGSSKSVSLPAPTHVCEIYRDVEVDTTGFTFKHAHVRSRIIEQPYVNHVWGEWMDL